jgi:hypothetical protein
MLSVLNNKGKYTGVQYAEDNPLYRAHHAALGQTCIWIGRVLENTGTDFNPDYGKPTANDLLIAGISTLPEAYLHVALSGGDNSEPVGILNDGVMSLHVEATLRTGEDPASQIMPLTGVWRVSLRDVKDDIADIVLVNFTNGTTEFDYTYDGKPTIMHIEENDLDNIPVPDGPTYKIRVLGDTTFKVYRDLTTP